MTIYQEITDSIIAELEKGAAPWVKPWNAPQGADKNIVSQRPYRGINRLILAMRGLSYAVPVWGTYKQWEQLGGQVKKGEKGTKIVFWSQAKSTNPEGEEKAYQFAKAYFVFNVSQVDGIDIIPSGDTISDNARNESCDKRIAATGANIVHGGDSACYIPSADVIRMPELGVFQSSQHYYATAFHELAHWTSDKTRCDRDLSKGKFGNAEYAFEELVAELSAAFLCQHHQIKGDLRHAGYIESWLKALKSDSKAIFKASGLAQQATDFLMAFAVSDSDSNDLLAA